MKRKCSNGKILVSAVLFLVLSILTLGVQEIVADPVNPGLYPLNSNPFGIPFVDWTIKWWQWFLKIPNSMQPFGDSTGDKCNVGQTGPVWFLVGSAGKVERSCIIPSDKAILFPVINTECSYSESPALKTKEELLNCAVEGNKGAIIMASVDNRSIVDLDSYRTATDLFNVTYADDPVFPTNSKMSQAVSDGWFIFLEPLPVGEHTIKFKATILGSVNTPEPTALIDVTYHLTIK